MLAIGTALCQPTSAAGTMAMNSERARQLYVICAACHGARGQGEQSLEAPALAGQQPDYMLRQLHLFATGSRGVEGDPQGMQMRRILKTISSQDDWEILGAYIGTLPVPEPGPSAFATTTKGLQLYQSCVACHGAGGEGSRTLESPRLSTLQAWYIANQLRKFKAGLRGATPEDAAGARMRAAVSVLHSEADIVAVAEYISGGSSK